MRTSKNIIAIPPGFTIKEQLSYRNMNQKEFSTRMDLSEKHTSHLLNGKVELSVDVALRLENVLGIPAHYWLSLENNFREKETRIKQEIELESEIEFAKKFPYKELVKLNWIEPADTKIDEVKNLRSYFGVAKLDSLKDLSIPGIAYRKTNINNMSDYNLAAWAQKARIESQNIDTEVINLKKLYRNIDYIRSLSTCKTEEMIQKLKIVLSESGVALVLLPHLKGSYLHGASFKTGNKIVLGLTLRGKYADKFWFSLFHEIHHILEKHIDNYFGTSTDDENAADEFSKNTLIPEDVYNEFISYNNINKYSIIEFSKEIGILPSIVVGRLQNDKVIPFSAYNNLKKKYELSN